jgi:hypothetical protein
MTTLKFQKRISRTSWTKVQNKPITVKMVRKNTASIQTDLGFTNFI